MFVAGGQVNMYPVATRFFIGDKPSNVLNSCLEMNTDGDASSNGNMWMETPAMQVFGVKTMSPGLKKAICQSMGIRMDELDYILTEQTTGKASIPTSIIDRVAANPSTVKAVVLPVSEIQQNHPLLEFERRLRLIPLSSLGKTKDDLPDGVINLNSERDRNWVWSNFARIFEALPPEYAAMAFGLALGVPFYPVLYPHNSGSRATKGLIADVEDTGLLNTLYVMQRTGMVNMTTDQKDFKKMNIFDEKGKISLSKICSLIPAKKRQKLNYLFDYARAVEPISDIGKAMAESIYSLILVINQLKTSNPQEI